MAKTAKSALVAVLLLAGTAFSESGRPSVSSSASAGRADQPAWGVTASPQGAYPFHRLVTSGGIRLYQGLFSSARGTSCPMHPHCSKFSLESFENNSPLHAFAMTTDRLLRCGHDFDQYRPVTVHGHLRYADAFSEDAAGAAGSVVVSDKTRPRLTDYDDSPFGKAKVDTAEPGREILRFAQQLALEGDYYRAITEYQRYLLYYPESPTRSHAQLALVNCYYRAGLYSDAVGYGEKVLSSSPEDSIAGQIVFVVGKSGFRAGDFSLAHDYFQRLAEGVGPYRGMAVMAQGLTYAHQLDWSKAAASFASIDSDSEHAMKARYCERLSREGADLGYKNPNVAGGLAVIPGLGYLYDGYPQTAMSALLINGLFMWGTYEAFNRDHPGLGVTLAIFGMGWYAGNFYGSITSAARRNEKMRRDLLLRFDIGYEF